VVLVGADVDLTMAIGHHLDGDGYTVAVASGVAQLEPCLLVVRPGVIIADTDQTGRVAPLSRSIRALDDTLLFVTGPREQDVELAVEAGADGYAVRTTSLRMLTARVRALLRRHADRCGRAAEPAVPGVEQLPRLRDRPTDGPASAVLEVLVRHPGKVVTRAELMRVLDLPKNQRVSLDGAVRRLRRQLEGQGGQPTIVTVRGLGYRFQHAPAEGALT
jgi:DNA-binding response OmpR family regulator